ncbi:MAG: glycosyltransferase family 9 protein [Crocinitomicaceae bacterium]|nr:glycosyltransferase family 9 protein [Crocinitomicaceae bacterium]
MKKILVIQTAFIGDVILATSLVEKLHRFFPDAKISILVRKGNDTLLQDHPFLDEVMVWDKKYNKYGSWWKVLRRIRKQHYDLVLNLQRFLSSGLLTVFSGAAQTRGFDKNPLSLFFSEKFPHRIDKEKITLHEVQRCLLLIENITDNSFQFPRIYPTYNDEQKISDYSVKKFITISPASVWFTKQLPANAWIGLINELKQYSIYLLGASSDRPLCEMIKGAADHPDVYVLAGKLSLLQSAALMKRAQMNYCNDSAPMHLCSAMDAPVTAVFCSTVPAFGFGPLSSHSYIVETREVLSCRPCGLHGYHACPQGHFKCSIIEKQDLLKGLQEIN